MFDYGKRNEMYTTKMQNCRCTYNVALEIINQRTGTRVYYSSCWLIIDVARMFYLFKLSKDNLKEVVYSCSLSFPEPPFPESPNPKPSPNRKWQTALTMTQTKLNPNLTLITILTGMKMTVCVVSSTFQSISESIDFDLHKILY